MKHYLPLTPWLLASECLAAAVESLKPQSIKQVMFGVAEMRYSQDSSCISGYCSEGWNTK